MAELRMGVKFRPAWPRHFGTRSTLLFRVSGVVCNDKLAKAAAFREFGKTVGDTPRRRCRNQRGSLDFT